ncbi:MAG: hypothetical protein NTNFB02_03320 [Nitrospira sp.]
MRSTPIQFRLSQACRPENKGPAESFPSLSRAYEAFTTNFLLQLMKPTTIGRGDSIGIIVPVLLSKQCALEELKHP